MSRLGKVLRVELNHMLHRLCEPPSIPLSFSLATILPRRGTYYICFAGDPTGGPPASAHRLRPGLPGYLIPFATLAFAPQRQTQARELPSPLVFLLISTHFTAPPRVPLSSPALELSSMRSNSTGEPWAFTPHWLSRLRALYAQ